jgi:hypothetical protein
VIQRDWRHPWSTRRAGEVEHEELWLRGVFVAVHAPCPTCWQVLTLFSALRSVAVALSVAVQIAVPAGVWLLRRDEPCVHRIRPLWAVAVGLVIQILIEILPITIKRGVDRVSTN